MDVEVEPPVDEATREAVERALDRLAEEASPPSCWWRAGTVENAGLADVEP